MTKASPPITVVATRGGVIESRHAVHAVAVDAQGRVLRAWGDAEQSVFPRSANKMIQALPFVESGAADKLGLGADELALACASHGGEAKHVAHVEKWLNRAGLTDAALECGTHWPYHEASAQALARAGSAPCPYHNNCSGKHAGMISTAWMLNEDFAGYVERDHPVQRRVTAAIEQVCAVNLRDAPWDRDGCSIPTIALPLRAFAHGLARFGSGAGLDKNRAQAARRLMDAMLAAPDMVAGTGRFCTRFMMETGIPAKTGAEGVYAAILPGQGVGVALKCADGATRAAEIALPHVLLELGLCDEATNAALASLTRAPIVNRRGIQTGEIKPAP